MIFFLTCNDCFLLRLFYFIKVILDFTFIILPIILIVLISIDLAKCVIANKDDDIKKNKRIAIKRIIYCVAAFFVPTIVNITMSLIHEFVDEDTKSTTLSCWVEANKDSVKTCTPNLSNNSDAANSFEEWLEQKPDPLPPSNSNNNSNNNNNNGSSNNNSENKNYTIYVGDSRTVGMCSAINIGNNAECIAKVGMGYNWLKQTALPSINNKLNNYKNSNVIINLGVNDLGTTNTSTINNYANNYAKIYNGIAKNYPDANIIIVSVGTVAAGDEKKQEEAVKNKYILSVITNDSVNKFNSSLEKALSGSNIKFCNINNNLSSKYKTINDGIHYTTDTYKSIFNEIQKCI